MRKLSNLGCLMVVPLVLLPNPVRAEAGEKETLIVLDLVSERGIDPGVVRLLNELLLTEFQQTGKYEVLGGSDLQVMLAAERQKDLLGCNDNACLATFGGALGADLLCTANIGRIGDFYILNVKILNVRTAKVVQRWSTQVEGVENKLLTAIRDSVAAMTGTTKPTPAATGSAAQPESGASAAPATSGPQIGTSETARSEAGVGVAPVVLWGVGAVSLVTASIFGFKTKTHYEAATDVNRVGRHVEIDEGESSQLITNVAAGVGLASTAAGLMVWLLSDGESSAAVTVGPTAHGSGLFASTSFVF